jgi:hypothetical protein
MLQFLRHQTKPIMITLAVIIIVAFTFWGGSTNSGSGQDSLSPDHTMLTALGKDYTLTDVRRLQRDFKIARELGLPGVQNYFAVELYRLKINYGDTNTGMPLMVEDAPVDFAANLVVLRDAMEHNGINASDDEVQQVFRGLGQFQENGQFNPDLAREYERSVGTRGMRLADVYEVIRDSIGFQKVHKLVAGNLAVNPKVASEAYTFYYQTIKAASIPFVLEDFKKNAKVTDEQISKYFDENKDNYQSPEKRAISYVLLEKPNTEGKNAEDTDKAAKEYQKNVEELATALLSPKADFETEVKKARFNPKLEVKSLPPFSMDAPPEPFKEDPGLLRAIFINNPKTHPTSDPVDTKKGYVIFKVTSIVPPAQQELKDVKDKVRDTLVEQKAREDMQKAANDAKKKLEEALKGGKKFDVAAKEAGLTPQMLPEFSRTQPLTGFDNGEEIAGEARLTAPGSFTKPIATEKGIILVHVISKELRKSEDGVDLKKSIASMVEQQSQANLFRAWFERRYEEAGVKFDTALLTGSLR